MIAKIDPATVEVQGRDIVLSAHLDGHRTAICIRPHVFNLADEPDAEKINFVLDNIDIVEQRISYEAEHGWSGDVNHVIGLGRP